MKISRIWVLTIVALVCFFEQAGSIERPGEPVPGAAATARAAQDTVSDLIALLDSLAVHAENSFFRQHCAAILRVIEAKDSLTAFESSLLAGMYATFADTSVQWNAGRLESYLVRKRPFIISWKSPTDSVVSLAWLLLPEDWDPGQNYPLYVTLHGLYAPYQNPIEYMARYLSPGLIVEKSFEDGYSLLPWGRGNLWYEGISETDIWESIEAAETLIKVDSTRKYLTGHSMGGYGVWSIAQKSDSVWAALGIYAGALQYGGNKLLNASVAEKLKKIPVYIVCGNQDGLMGLNQTAYQLLQNAGNEHLQFTTFSGGHESLLENWQGMFAWIKNFTNERQAVEVEHDSQTLPRAFSLSNYPNPFNPKTVISYQLPVISNVSLKVYNILGSEVATLVEGQKEAGYHTIDFDGSRFSSGVYFVRLIAQQQEGRQIVQVKKLVLLK